jgi:hypothetical protein
LRLRRQALQVGGGVVLQQQRQVRVGTNLVTVLSTDGHDNGAATAKKLTAQIVANLQKKG